jgi:hypothetical protein
VAPEAVSVALLPEHIAALLTVTVSVVLTVTTDAAVPEHPAVVPVTV